MEFSDYMLEERERDKSRLSIALLRLFEVHRPIVARTVIIIRLACYGLWCQGLLEQCPQPTLLDCSDGVVRLGCLPAESGASQWSWSQ